MNLTYEDALLYLHSSQPVTLRTNGFAAKVLILDVKTGGCEVEVIEVLDRGIGISLGDGEIVEALFAELFPEE